MDRVAVLGGSTPFAAGLVDALAQVAGLPPCHLVLHGRDARGLEAVATYARAWLGPLGWQVEGEHTVEAAVDGATVVIQQIRFGGMEGRAADERLALRFGLPADETLGPAALRCALRAAPPLRELGALLARHAPDAWVVNLSNPLSVTTSVLAAAGVRRCLGTCELAVHTAAAAARTAGYEPGEVRWNWAGLNHRAFLTHLGADGEDLFGRFLAGVGPGDSFLGVPREALERLGAVPTKYHALLANPGCPPAAGRADYLGGLRDRVLGELRARPGARPASLAGRGQPWYPDAVVPLLAALMSLTGAEVTVTSADGDGVARERRAEVSRSGVRALPDSPVPPAVREWLDRLEEHERAVLAAIDDPSPRTLSRAVRADPLAGAAWAGPVADALWHECRPTLTGAPR